MSEFEISVIIPTYNGINLLTRTLKGLEKQNSDSPPFEVIVVDDGSTDGTADFLDSYKGNLNLKIIRLPRNRGRSTARNAAINVASSKRILLLDADMDSPADLIAYHVSAHNGQNHAIIGSVKFERRIRLRGYSRYWEGRGAQRSKQKGETSARYFLSGHSSLPTELARQIGGFDEDIAFYGEDIDFGLRISAAGAKVIYDPNISTVHLHQRPLISVLCILREYGRLTIPILLTKHPHLSRELGIEWGSRQGILGSLRRLLLTAPIYYPLLLIGLALDRLGIASPLYTYLGYRSYFYGYRTSQNS